MFRHILIIAFCSFLLFGCVSAHKDTDLLKEAELLSETSSEESMQKLLAIKNFSRLSENDKANCYYLLTKNQLYTNTRFVSDSTINKAIHYYRKSGDSIKLLNSLYFKGMIKFITRDYSSSIKAFQQSNKIAIPLNDLKAIITNYQQIGFSWINLNRPQLALENHIKAVEKAYILKDTTILVNTLINLGESYRHNGNSKTSIIHFTEALLLAEKKRDIESQQIILNQLSTLNESMNDYAKALEYNKKSHDLGINRSDVPSMNLAKAILFDKQRLYDSAYHYAQIAIKGNDTFVADVAYSLLSDWEKRQGHIYEALGYRKKMDNMLEAFNSNIQSAGLQQKYQKEKLENENNQLKIKQKEKDILLLIILLTVSLVTAIVYVYFLSQKKKRTEQERAIQEELLKNKSYQLEQENLLLKQAKEISLLREKEALLRESLIRRINLFNKIPSLSSNEHSDEESTKKQSQKIRFAENDWNELIQGINDVYPNFIHRLQQTFEQIDEDDIRFCCLVKIDINLQDLSDIYCLSKSAITKKKYRLKKDTFGITDNTISLDDFLRDF